MQLSPELSAYIGVGLGLCSAAYLVWMLVRLYGSKSWPSTPGKMLKSNVVEDSDGWAPRVRYCFTVRGRKYTHDRLYFHLSTRMPNAKGAMVHLDPYPVGKQIDVYYNPRNPQEAVLDREMPIWLVIFWIVFTAILLGIGLAC